MKRMIKEPETEKNATNGSTVSRQTSTPLRERTVLFITMHVLCL